jgi:hypothetical protein
MANKGAGGENMEGKTTLAVIGVMALALWVVTIVALGWFFVNGWTKPAADGRTEIVLAPAERDQILAEMRQLLKAVEASSEDSVSRSPMISRWNRRPGLPE